MIDLDYTSFALWLGMNPAFLEHGQNRPWVPKQNQDSVWEKEGECDCCLDNYDANVIVDLSSFFNIAPSLSQILHTWIRTPNTLK